MEKAEGKYLMFADADDYYCENTCETMYNAIESRNADFVIGNYINTDKDGVLWGKPVFNTEKYDDFKWCKYWIKQKGLCSTNTRTTGKNRRVCQICT